MAFPELVKLEPLLRKILYLVSPSDYQRLETEKKGLAGYINQMRLNPQNVDFENSNIVDLIGKPDFCEHLFRVYNLRNIESHQCEEWNNKDFFQNIESILVVYIYVINKYSVQLNPIVKNVGRDREPDFKLYLESVKKDFKSRIGRFVHIKSQEDLRLSQSYVVENLIGQDGEKIERKGTVNDLRKSKIPERRMLLWGDAGMGKSTTLEYLAHADAEKKLRDSDSVLPIYIALGLLTDKDLSLKQAIFNKIGIDDMIGERMLKDGRINLFLDAVNEIPKDGNNQLRTLRQREIQNLLNEYKKCFIIISNRPQDQNIFVNIPVFQLQKMDREQIELFVKRNVDDKQLEKIILKEIDNDKRLEKIIMTPLMLSRLIEIVKVKGDIPRSEGEIIHSFIHSLYQREVEEKKDANFNIKIIHRLLRYLGYESLEKKDTNAGMTEDEVLNYLVDCKQKYGFDIDTVYVLEIATQLGILENRDNMYSFAHQVYQDYYHAQEEKAILGL